MRRIKKHMLSFKKKKENPDDIIKVTLIQEQYPKQLIGKRAGQGMYVGKMGVGVHSHESRLSVTSMLEHIAVETDIAIISEHPGNAFSLDLLQRQSDRQQQLIIARLGYHLNENEGKICNSVAVISPEQPPVFVDQISFSTEDLKFEADEILHRGNEIHVFSTPLGNLGVISCHDYTHADILKQIFEHNIEILVVSSFNPATRLFMQYALADIHRFSCFVIISNIANYGGSGVFAPFRYNGPKRASMSLGGALAYTQGQSRAYLEVDLPIAHLRKLRHGESTITETFEDAIAWTPIYPSEEFITQGEPDYKRKLVTPDFLETIDLAQEGYLPTTQDDLQIGVAHLQSMDKEDYIDNYYCISCSKNVPGYITNIKSHLHFLAEKLENTGQRIDFLVFPELFLPLTLEGALKDFARRFNTIIIGGMEFDPQPDDLECPEMAQGVNRCFVYLPTQTGEVRRFQYDKLTRSQYDARTPSVGDSGWGYFKMPRGNHLIRFACGDQWSFAVLICYDYSHFDIIHRLNRDPAYPMPPDMLFIVASNPDSQLYERCCIADSHRFYQYIIMSNVSQYGGSGIFAPIKTPGRRQTLFNSGLGTEAISIAKVAWKDLQAARQTRDLDTGSYFQNKPGIFQELKENDLTD